MTDSMKMWVRMFGWLSLEANKNKNMMLVKIKTVIKRFSQPHVPKLDLEYSIYNFF